MKYVLYVFVLLLSCSVVAEEPAEVAGSGKYAFESEDGDKEKGIVIYFHKPTNLNRQSPVLLVIPGSGRNAWNYRDAWINASEKHGVLILSPHYPETHYPMFWDYNIAGMISDVEINEARTGFESFSTNKDPQDWIFKDFDGIFNEAIQRFGLDAEGYDMFGHSAGGQILQRFALFDHNNKAHRLIASNAGWYTVPELNTLFPYGLKNSVASKDDLRMAFKTNLVVLLGELDNENEARGHLARNHDVDVQGTHRLARGRYFFRQAEKAARNLGAEFNWKLKVVLDVGHDYTRMSEAAAELLYDN